jgi:hypothetical protein
MDGGACHSVVQQWGHWGVGKADASQKLCGSVCARVTFSVERDRSQHVTDALFLNCHNLGRDNRVTRDRDID